MLKKIVIIGAVVALSACNKTEPNKDVFSKGLQTYLEQRGHLCLSHYTWPVHVPAEEFPDKGRDAIQMPVLEKLGLVKASQELVTTPGSDGAAPVQSAAVRYELTDAGRQYYQQGNFTVVGPDGTRHPYQADFCLARITLGDVVSWSTPVSKNGVQTTVVNYTYKAEPVPWMSNPAAQQAFPMIARVINGAGSQQLQEPFALTSKGWEAQDSVN